MFHGLEGPETPNDQVLACRMNSGTFWLGLGLKENRASGRQQNGVRKRFVGCPGPVAPCLQQEIRK